MTKKLLVRVIFCAYPAFLIGLFLSIIDMGIGVIFFIAIFGLGWQVTSPKLERGEGNQNDR